MYIMLWIYATVGYAFRIFILTLNRMQWNVCVLRHRSSSFGSTCNFNLFINQTWDLDFPSIHRTVVEGDRVCRRNRWMGRRHTMMSIEFLVVGWTTVHQGHCSAVCERTYSDSSLETVVYRHGRGYRDDAFLPTDRHWAMKRISALVQRR